MCQCNTPITDILIDGVTEYTIEVQAAAAISGTGGLRFETIYVDPAATVVTDDKLKGSSLFAIIWIEGAPVRYTQYGIDWDGVAGSLDFTGYGQQVSGYIDIIIKD